MPPLPMSLDRFIAQVEQIVERHARSSRPQDVTVDVPSRYAFSVATHLETRHFARVVRAVGGEHFECDSGTLIRVRCGVRPRWPPRRNATHYWLDPAVADRIMARHV